MADPTRAEPTRPADVTRWLLDLDDRLGRFEPVDPEEVRAYGRLRDRLTDDMVTQTADMVWASPDDAR